MGNFKLVTWWQRKIDKQQQRIAELEVKLSNKACPLGDECDLAGAYMAGLRPRPPTQGARQ